MALSHKAKDYLAAIPTALSFYALLPYIGAGKALATTTTACVFSVIISQKWENRIKIEFWVCLGVFLAFHVLAIAFIPFPEPKFGLVAVPFGFLDLFLMLWIMNRTGLR